MDHFSSSTETYIIPNIVNLEGLNVDVELLKETGQIFLEYGILPYAGGWLQQPRWWTYAMRKYYLPGISRAKYDALPAEDKKMYHSRPKKIVIPEGAEW